MACQHPRHDYDKKGVPRKLLVLALQPQGHHEEFTPDWHDKHHDEQTAVHAAIKNGHFEVTKLLLEHNLGKSNAKTWSPEAKTRYQETPIIFAARYGYYSIAKYLLEKHKVKTHVKGRNKKGPLYWAMQPPESYYTNEQIEGKKKIIKLLETKGTKRMKLEL